MYVLSLPQNIFRTSLRLDVIINEFADMVNQGKSDKRFLKTLPQIVRCWMQQDINVTAIQSYYCVLYTG